MQDTVVLKFGTEWNSLVCTEVVKLGQMMEEDSYVPGHGMYSFVWYRYGNMMVKQARPSDKRNNPYTITREFTDKFMLTKFSTDNNTLSAEVIYTRI